MNEEQMNTVAPLPPPSDVSRRFVVCVDEGEVRRELSEDCILTLLGRTVKGSAAVTSYITGRFKHVGFQEAKPCEESRQSLLKDRYARSFQVLRRHQRAKKPSYPSMFRRAERDEDYDVEFDYESDGVCWPAPPRAEIYTAKSSEQIHYIESIGVLQPCHDPEVSGFNLGESCQVRLTLGFRHYPLVLYSECQVEVCLVVYEKYKLTTRTSGSGLQRHSRMRISRNVGTDDEGEVLPAPRSVRRTLFTSEDTDEPLERPPAEDSESITTQVSPRKRQHNNYSNEKAKRPSLAGGMRF